MHHVPCPVRTTANFRQECVIYCVPAHQQSPTVVRRNCTGAGYSAGAGEGSVQGAAEGSGGPLSVYGGSGCRSQKCAQGAWEIRVEISQCFPARQSDGCLDCCNGLDPACCCNRTLVDSRHMVGCAAVCHRRIRAREQTASSAADHKASGNQAGNCQPECEHWYGAACEARAGEASDITGGTGSRRDSSLRTPACPPTGCTRSVCSEH